MSSQQELIDNDPELNFRKRELFEQRYATNKYRILNRIDQVINMFEGQVQRKGKDDPEVPNIQAKIHFLHEFKSKVSATTLPENLDGWWAYSFSLGAQRATLYLNHYDGCDIEGEEGNEYISMWNHDEEFPLVSVRAALLSTEEFAALHHVAGPTIRVWIRRGKIRSAVKVGNTWKIPELASPICHSYESVSYQWKIPLEDVPAIYATFKGPGKITISQDRQNKQLFEVMHYDEDEQRIGEFKVNSKDAEKLEAFLIAHPNVSYIGDTEFYD